MQLLAAHAPILVSTCYFMSPKAPRMEEERIQKAFFMTIHIMANTLTAPNLIKLTPFSTRSGSEILTTCYVPLPDD